MHSARGVGARRSENLDAIIESTLELMLEQGYAAVTYRSVATRAGVAAGLVQYYFSSLDDLFIAVLRRRTDEIIEALTEVTTAEQPLRAVWEYASNRTGTALLMEFMALANHRKAIAGVIGEGGERMRRALLDTLSAKWASSGSSEDDLSPPAALFLMFCIPRMAHLEESLGTFTGHAEAFAWWSGSSTGWNPERAPEEGVDEEGQEESLTCRLGIWCSCTEHQTRGARCP